MKDLTLLSDEEFESKYKRFKEYQQNLWEEEIAYSAEKARRLLKKALNVIHKVKWETKISLDGSNNVHIYLSADDRNAPKEYTDLFDGYHGSVYVDSIPGYEEYDIRLATNDGDLSISGEPEDVLKFVKAFKIPVNYVVDSINVYRNRLVESIRKLDDIEYLITGERPIEL